MKKEDLIKVYAYAGLLWNTFITEKEDFRGKLQDNLWYEFLKDYDLNIIYSAMREYAKESDFCNIAKISNGCEIIMRLVNNEITAEEMWEDFSETLKKVKEIRYKEELQNIFNELNDNLKRFIGGWKTLKDISLLEFEQLQFERNRFIKQFYDIKKENKIKKDIKMLCEENKKLLEICEN